MSKKPYMPFYIGDYKKDVEVQSLDRYCRNVWLDMMCLMWESQVRGYLLLGGKPMSRETIARNIGEDNQNFEICLTKILEFGCFDIREDGAIFSRRMVRENELSVKRAKSGSQGGNPNLVKQNASKPPSKTQANSDIDIDIDIDNAIDLSINLKEFDTAPIQAEVSLFAKKIKRDSNGSRELHQQTLDNWLTEYQGRPADFLDDLKFSNGLVRCWNLKKRDKPQARGSPAKKSTKETIQELYAQALAEEQNAKS